jgi:hypothetical protein
MTTLRRAFPSLFEGESIKALAAVCAVLALLAFAGQPLSASTHGGGGGGGGSHGGGGGHASSHASGGHASGGVRSAHPVGRGGYYGPNRGYYGRGGGFYGRGGAFYGHGLGFGRGYYGYGYGSPFVGFGLGFGLGLGFAWDYPWGWGPGYYGYSDPYYVSPGLYNDGGGYSGYNNGYYNNDDDDSASAPPAGRSRQTDMGALDLDISPSDTQVYLNGEYIGRVRDFGGWRRGYLWLEKGTYDVVFYHEGFKTLARQVTVYPGLVITWDDKLVPGDAVRPEDLATKTHDRRDARLQFESDRARQIDAQQMRGAYYQPPPPPPSPQNPQYPQNADQAPPPAPQDGGGWNSWRDRVQPQQQADGGAPPPPPAGHPKRSSRLHLNVEPADASVYLDGHLIGAAGEVSSRSRGLMLLPGQHKLSVVRPGLKAEERDFTSTVGQDVNLQVTLSQSAQ